MPRMRTALRRVAVTLAVGLGVGVGVAALLGAVPPAGAASAEPGSRPDDTAATAIRIGTEGTYPPFSYKDGNELTGYDVEVAQAVAEEAGWDATFVETTWDSIFPALDAGRIDTIANQVTISPDREAKYVFSEPYAYSRGVLVTKADDDSIKTLDDIAGKVAAGSATSNWAEVARDAGAKLETVDQFAQAAELLVQGRVDVIVNDNIAVLDYLARTGNDEIKIAGDAGAEVSEQALVFRQDDTALAEQATAALQRLRSDGRLADISDEYFGADISVEGGGEVEVSKDKAAGRSSLEVIEDTVPEMVIKAIAVTIPLSLVCFVLGLALAVLVALARISRSPWLRWPARAFVSAIRGTPLLVQLFIVFYGLPQIGLKIESYPAAVLAFSLNVAGYAAEIVRSAILSVPKGQSEAAATIGMGYALTLRRVVLPQAARVAVPPLANTFLSLVKDTSLAAVVLVTELFRVATVAASATGRFMELLSLAAVFYWVICTALSWVQDRLEIRLGRYVAS